MVRVFESCYKIRLQLGADYDVTTHFTPRYNPWEQRLCLVPDGDFFKAIRRGRASVVTGQIERFTEKGIRLQSGEELEADIIITATGLVLQAFGGADLEVDGRPVELGKSLAYKGVMLSGVPNLASVFGYVNASWTLKADLICNYVCRLLNAMDRKGMRQVTPRCGDETGVAPVQQLDLVVLGFDRCFLPGQQPRLFLQLFVGLLQLILLLLMVTFIIHRLEQLMYYG